ncbi:related to methyltransferase S. pombe [Cephalotrichum gorgonifer]|uniref:Related to methyltransferase S. pombe n=1 Tax=Cephalotrichum gorgonifer TaxID=2041049 RepID=A0AAE8MPC3_9PEZI|nr:related to methyltransferase S. pombe [Cephalotrichum gorgonifer]
MLPTPDTSHIPTSLVYDPVEDSYLLLDTFSSPSETAFLKDHFPLTSPSAPQSPSPIPVVLELGSGSGVVSAFLASNARHIFGRPVLSACTDLNPHACRATAETIRKELSQRREDGAGDGAGVFLGVCNADLEGPWVSGAVDVLVFNPPYVPTPDLPVRPDTMRDSADGEEGDRREPTFEEEEYYLGLAYAGGYDGMEVTNRLIERLPDILSARGCAYIVLCAQNHPEEVKQRIRDMGAEWRAETAGTSGKKAGWEKLQIMRAWRVHQS